MRALFYGVGALLAALGLLALGADIYWTLKAQAWTFEPVAGWLDRIDPAWSEALRDWAAERSVRALRTVERVLAWPVWAPAFIIGGILWLFTRRR